MARRTDSFIRYHVGLRDALAERSQGSLPQPAEVKTLKRRVAGMRYSFNTDDRTAVKRIDRIFSHSDAEAANNGLSGKLYRPDETYGRNITEWIQKGNDADIAMFCAWNLARTQALQSRLHQDWLQLADGIMARIERLTDINLFPPHAPAVMDTALSKNGFLVMDSFQSGGMNAAGYYLEYNRTITLANLYSDRTGMTGLSPELSRTAFHEYMHAAGYNGGFSSTSTSIPHILRPIEEAFVEHTTVVAHSGASPSYEIIDPNRRPNDRQEYSTYRLERILLDTIGVAPEQLADVYFSPRDSEHGERLREDLYRKIGAAFGSTGRFFAFINEYENAQPTRRAKLVQQAIKAIAPPYETTTPRNFSQVWTPLPATPLL